MIYLEKIFLCSYLVAHNRKKILTPSLCYMYACKLTWCMAPRRINFTMKMIFPIKL